MSPLAIILMRVLRAGLFASAALVAVFICLDAWKNWNGTQDKAFLGALAVLLIGSVWLALSIGRELSGGRGDKSGGG